MTKSLKLMILIKFLKPDLKRIIVLLIISIPYILASFVGVGNYDSSQTLFMIMIGPAIFLNIILFGWFDTGNGLFPSLANSPISTVVFYSTLVLFWYFISCVVVTVYSYIFKKDS